MKPECKTDREWLGLPDTTIDVSLPGDGGGVII